MGLRSCDPSVLSLLLSSQPGAAEAGALLCSVSPPGGWCMFGVCCVVGAQEWCWVFGSLRGAGWAGEQCLLLALGMASQQGALGGDVGFLKGARASSTAVTLPWSKLGGFSAHGHQIPKERGANKSSALRLLCGLLMFNISTEKPGVEMFPNPLVPQVET